MVRERALWRLVRRYTRLPRVAPAVVTAFVAGCASGYVSSAVMPNINLHAYRSFYVVAHEQDSNNVHGLIAAGLKQRGADASSGPAVGRRADADVIVTYEDRWQWDMTMYMITLKIDLRDPHSNVLLASGQAYHPSLERRSADAMVHEVLASIFGKTG